MSHLRLKQLTIHRFHSIRGLLYPESSLSPGINLIHGPNGSGKTTTSRAIAGLFWPELVRQDRPTLEAVAESDNGRWSVSLDAGHPRWISLDGQAPHPQLPPTERSASYRLALHELLRAEDHDFAMLIQQEAFGGLDLPTALDALGFQHKQPNSNLGACRELRDAQRKARDLADQQRQLHQQANDLTRLNRRLQAAQEARAEALLWERLQAWQEAKQRCREARLHLDSFDPRIARLDGEEAAELRQLRRQLNTANADRDRLRSAVETAKDTLTAIQIDDREAAADQLERLRTKAAKIQDLDHYHADLVAKAAASRQDADRCAPLSPPELTDDQLDVLDNLQLKRLIEWGREAERLRAQDTALNALDQVLTCQMEPDPKQLQRLQDGLRDLERWLTSPPLQSPVDQRRDSFSWIVAVAAGLPWLILSFTLHWLWLLGLAPVGWLLWRQRPEPTPPPLSDPRAEAEADYLRHQLTAPASWDADAVRQQHQALLDERIQLEQAAELATARRHRVDAEQKKLQTQREALDEAREQLLGGLQVPAPLHELQLVKWLDELLTWRQAELESRAFADQLAENRRQLDVLLQQCQEEAADDTPLTSQEDVQVLLRRLERRLDQYDQARLNLRELQQDLKTAEHQHQHLVTQRRTLLQRLYVEDSDDPETLSGYQADLDRLCKQRDAYQTASAELKQAEWKQQDTDKALATMNDFLEFHREIPPEDVTKRLRECQEQAATENDLREQIASVRALVDKAKRGHDLEAALHAQSEAEAALIAWRDDTIDASLGELLASHIREQTSQHTSQVLSNARNLMTQMTHARYDLRISTTAPPEFTARDNTTGHIHALDTLSSGTRVQLLLAVRLGFIEQQEGGGPALPLLLDELLGTTDDERASAVIEAVIAMARRGRQIFYFTAQHDEVGKWLAHLQANDDVAHAAIPLGSAEPTTLPQPLPAPARVPPPGDHSYHAYGELIGVPPINPWLPVSAVHLWYVMEAPAPLHQALNQGIASCGQLQILLDSSDQHVLTTYRISDDTRFGERLSARIGLLDRLLRLWRHGRGKPVTREVLEDSDAVSETFIDAVTELCHEVNGEADLLIAGLRDKRVSGFRSNKLEELEAYLSSHGYLVQETPLTATEVELKLMAEVSDQVKQGLLTHQTIKQAISWLFAETPSPA